jgi:N-methylhydantoinase A
MPDREASQILRIGADIGGTFTDIVALAPDGTMRIRKVSSTPDDYSRGLVDGVCALMAELGAPGSSIDEFRHGTTVASNAILEGKGAQTGLITTKGFRDILEIRTLRMPRLYDMAWEKPPVLVPRYLRLEVDERVRADGSVARPLDAAEVRKVVDALIAEGVEAISVCLLHAYANPHHETMIGATIREAAPGLPVSLSHEVLPEINEYSRVSTTVINSYVKPVVGSYLTRLRARLDESGIAAPILLMQSNGGLTSAHFAAEFPMNIVESGPAAGVTGAQAIAASAGLDRIITFDMGGTTAKAALVENGVSAHAAEFQVGGGLMVGSRLLTGAGYALKVPAIDLAEVGAGGGSHVWIDAGGSLRVGPESAGARPGPVCYDLGGDIPTVTDANVVLGYLNPTALAAGTVPLNADKARAVFARTIAEPLGLSLEEAAYGAYRIAAANMLQAIRAVSIERGRDPRDFALFAFGGNGPLFGAAMAREMEIRTVIVPPSPGVFSAFGLLLANLERHVSRRFFALLGDVGAEALEAAFEPLAATARKFLQDEGVATDMIEVALSADLRYRGQSSELTLPVPAGGINPATLAALRDAFDAEHARTYGHRGGDEEAVEIVTIHAVGRAVGQKQPLPPTDRLISQASGSRSRRAYFGPEHGLLETRVIARADLTQEAAGPLIVEEYDATCVVPPGTAARLDDFGNIVIRLG